MLQQQLVRAAALAVSQQTGSSQQVLVALPALGCVSSALQHHSQLGSAAAAAAGWSFKRAASSKGRGRKHPSHVKGYDRLLSQWHHMTARPGTSSSTNKAKRAHGGRHAGCHLRNPPTHYAFCGCIAHSFKTHMNPHAFSLLTHLHVCPHLLRVGSDVPTSVSVARQLSPCIRHMNDLCQCIKQPALQLTADISPVLPA